MDEVASAARCAKVLSRAWGSLDWRDYLSAAWEGVREAGARGLTGRDVYRIVRCRVIDRLRVETGHRRLVRAGVTVHQFACDKACQYGGDPRFVNTAAELVPDHREPVGASPDRRLLVAWCDHRRARLHVCPRLRLVAYLYLVEGQEMSDIGRALRVTESRVSGMFKQFRAALAAPPPVAPTCRLCGAAYRRTSGPQKFCSRECRRVGTAFTQGLPMPGRRRAAEYTTAPPPDADRLALAAVGLTALVWTYKGGGKWSGTVVWELWAGGKRAGNWVPRTGSLWLRGRVTTGAAGVADVARAHAGEQGATKC